MKKIVLTLCLFFFTSKSILSKEDNSFEDFLVEYKNFSAILTQVQDNQLSMGKISIAKKRIRLDYFDPSKITLIINSKKGMYFNIDLNEVQFFSTKNTEAFFFYQLFYNNDFLKEFTEVNKKKSLIYNKKQTIVDEEVLIDVIFEKNPFLLREIILKGENINIKLGLADHNFNPIFKKKFFSMADPTLR